MVQPSTHHHPSRSCQVFTWAGFTLPINKPVSISVISVAGRNLCSHLAGYQLVCVNTSRRLSSLYYQTVLLRVFINDEKYDMRGYYC